MSRQVKTYVSPEEYLAFERKAENKNEYVNGEVFAVTGASRKHNLIAGNIYGELRQQLKGKPCEAYPGEMRVKAPARSYVYPDVVIVCDEPKFEDAYFDTLLNPNAGCRSSFEIHGVLQSSCYVSLLSHHRIAS